MDQLANNPLGMLTFIVAPAILTNASSVMTLGTTNRFARAIDRVRELAAEVEGKEHEPDDEIQLRLRQLRSAERRLLLLVRALTAFYTSVGSFGAASLVSLLAAVFFVAHQDELRVVAMALALAAGCCGVGGLMIGSGLLAFETRLALRILNDETEFRLSRSTKKT